jgi:hypothetical protein
MTVDKKLTEDKIEERPAIWSEKIHKSKHCPPCPNAERGGYNVQPAPTPTSLKDDNKSNNKDGGSNQKDKEFKRGKAISPAPRSKGRKKLPSPPIKNGITIKKTITNAWAVTMTLKVWSSLKIIPEEESSVRINTEKNKPNKPDKDPNIR